MPAHGGRFRDEVGDGVNHGQSKAGSGPTWRRTGEAAQIRRLFCRGAGPDRPIPVGMVLFHGAPVRF
jgi:hypothetical protein